MSRSHASDNRGTVTTMRLNVLGALLLAVLAPRPRRVWWRREARAQAADDDRRETTETTETTETGDSTTGGSTIPDTDGSYQGNSPICKAITNTSHPINFAASTGDFETVANEWEALAADAPAAVKPSIETIVEGYRKVDEDPAGYGVMDTEPYKGALEKVHAWTGTNCAQ